MFNWWSCFSFHWSCLHISKLKSTKLLPSGPTHFMCFAIKTAQFPVLLHKDKFPVLSSRDLLYYLSLTSHCFPESFPSARRLILHLYKMITGFHIPAARTPSYSVLSWKTNSQISVLLLIHPWNLLQSHSNSTVPLNPVLFGATELPLEGAMFCPLYSSPQQC